MRASVAAPPPSLTRTESHPRCPSHHAGGEEASAGGTAHPFAKLSAEAKSRLSLDHHVFFFDRNGKCLGSIRALDEVLAGFDAYVVNLGSGSRRVAPGLPGTHVEFPAVPGTAQDLAVAAVPIDPWLGGFDETDQSSLGKIAALMRAAVEQGEQFAVDVEDHDGAAVDIDQLTAAGRQLPRRRDHVLSHAASP